MFDSIPQVQYIFLYSVEQTDIQPKKLASTENHKGVGNHFVSKSLSL